MVGLFWTSSSFSFLAVVLPVTSFSHVFLPFSLVLLWFVMSHACVGSHGRVKVLSCPLKSSKNRHLENEKCEFRIDVKTVAMFAFQHFKKVIFGKVFCYPIIKPQILKIQLWKGWKCRSESTIRIGASEFQCVGLENPRIWGGEERYKTSNF